MRRTFLTLALAAGILAAATGPATAETATVGTDSREWEAPVWPSAYGALELEPRTKRKVCVYSPTYNYDWHDDMVCGGVRQYFRPNDDFITAAELNAAADRWERRHN